jgi:hypothetical protein
VRLAIIRNTPELTEIEFRNSESRELIVAYIRENRVLITREENGQVLQAATFGAECLKIVRDWMNTPMKDEDKADAIERFKGIKISDEK